MLHVCGQVSLMLYVRPSVTCVSCYMCVAKCRLCFVLHVCDQVSLVLYVRPSVTCVSCYTCVKPNFFSSCMCVCTCVYKYICVYIYMLQSHTPARHLAKNHFGSSNCRGRLALGMRGRNPAREQPRGVRCSVLQCVAVCCSVNRESFTLRTRGEFPREHVNEKEEDYVCM